MGKRVAAKKSRRRSAAMLRRQAQAWLDQLPPTDPRASLTAPAAIDRGLARLEKTDPELRRAVGVQIWRNLRKTLAQHDRWFARWLKDAKRRAAARAPHSQWWREQAARLARL